MNVHASGTGRPLRFLNARVPLPLIRGFEAREHDRATGLASVDFSIAPDGTLAAGDQPGLEIDLGGRIVLPTFIDSHVHLDKAYIVRRTGIPVGGLPDAVALSSADAVNWSPGDLRARMTRALERAWLHGTCALRTHIDTPLLPADCAGWQVVDEMRRQWRDRIDIQAVALMAIERVDETADYEERCRQIASMNGVLGAFVAPDMATPERLDALFGFAGEHALDVDFHVDETLAPSARGLELICDSILRTGFDRTVVAGHCCSLSTMAAPDRERIVAKVAEAGVRVISLPHSNLFLQDRADGATPLRRGITAVRELNAAGASIHFASDNVQDPFYPYGDFDMVEVFRSAVRIAHLDDETGGWLARQFSEAAGACGFTAHGTLTAGATANLIVFGARDLYDLMSTSPCERVVLRGGAPVQPLSLSLRDLFAVEYP